MDDNDLLQSMRIAAPCSMDWTSMRYTEDDRIRFCGQCKLNVYNLSEMSTKEAATLIRDTEGKLCMRLYKRRDGTVITDNCPVGLRKVRDKARQLVAASIAACAWLGLPQATTACPDSGDRSAAYSEPVEVTMGGGGTIGPQPYVAPTVQKEPEEIPLVPAAILSISGILAFSLLIRKLAMKRKASLWALGGTAAAVLLTAGFAWGIFGLGHFK